MKNLFLKFQESNIIKVINMLKIMKTIMKSQKSYTIMYISTAFLMFNISCKKTI